MNFIHLHVHSPFSFLDGASSVKRLLEKAAGFNMPALALTDHNRLTGAIRFYEKAKQMGIKPIIGTEIDIKGGYHLTLLCKNSTGYSNLCRLLTESHLANRNVKPELSRAVLEQFSSGLIALSGCGNGEIPRLINKGEFEAAVNAADFYKSIFGDDFFVELIRHPSNEVSVNDHMLLRFAREKELPVVATNNVHYANMEEYAIKELLNAIDQIIPVAALKGFRTVEKYLKSPDEMETLFGDCPDSLLNTVEIASRCNLELVLGQPRFPLYVTPEGESEHRYLEKLAYQGAIKKLGNLSSKVKKRLELELDTIKKLGFSGYFLVVWDIVEWAVRKGIRCQARGSAVDSLVVYVLGISNVDPLQYDLLFERFMHPLRKEPPDIDIDIDRQRRDEVRDYIYEKYGSENVACVGTINTYMARGAIRD
ncbi:MAG: PHP domain-containing protein, partial [Chloroflexi bacterium]|nr:PHP domain-containing protein [Chloroflexota bacterium]